MCKLGSIAAVALVCGVGVAQAADYYVATTGNDGNDGSKEAPFLTIDKAVITARMAGDVIHVLPGTYETTLGLYDSDYAKWGPNLCVKMIGHGASRDDVVLKASGHRTLRMASGAWVENMTLEGEPEAKADKGGVLEISGGTITNCVVKNGTATGNGGNIYMTAGVVTDCLIQDGFIKSTNTEWNGPKGANVCLNGANARLIRCHITGGATTEKEDGSLYYERGSVQSNNASAQVENCLIEGSACGGLLMQAAGSQVYNTTIVNNLRYGVWSWNEKQTLVNCVIFGNRKQDGTVLEWSGNQPTSTGAQFINCAMATNTLSTTTFPTLVVIDENDFADYAAGDYHPAQGSALIDAGGADPRGASASTTDLEGHPRMSGTIDIGCFEFQKPDMIVRISGMTLDQTTAPAVATFTHVAENSEFPENEMTFTYDFGDGSGPETVATGTITHTYEKPGVYTVTITARNESEEAEMVYDGYAQIASDTVYVTLGNAKPEFPYDTPEKGFASLKAAVSAAADGYTILVGEGVYEMTAQTSVGKALTIVGLGATPEGVILRNTVETPDTYYHRTIELNNAGASLANVTIENGRVKNHWGANLRVAGGAMVSNCVIRAGRTVADNGNAAGSAVVMGGANSILTHCIITNNVIEGSSNDQNYAGGTIFIEYGAKNAHLSNLLIAENRYVTSGDPKRGTAGIRFGGGNDYSTVENCTIVNNTVEGSCTGDSAGIYCTTWHGIIRNNIIVGNRETGKDKCTSVELDISGGSNYQYRNNITDDKLIEGSATKATDNLLVSDITAIFKDFAKGDYTLKTTSPACNKGTQTALSLKPVVDLAGNPRVFDIADKSRIDIGCYECQKKSGFVIAIR